jgi:hypothetical protein
VQRFDHALGPEAVINRCCFNAPWKGGSREKKEGQAVRASRNRQAKPLGRPFQAFNCGAEAIELLAGRFEGAHHK